MRLLKSVTAVEQIMGDPVSTYSVELPIREHSREDVKEAKNKELINLDNYGVFTKVSDEGQSAIGARWVITEKEAQDEQKTKVKAHFVAHGFQEMGARCRVTHQLHKENL